jgi:hypothetical protein
VEEGHSQAEDLTVGEGMQSGGSDGIEGGFLEFAQGNCVLHGGCAFRCPVVVGEYVVVLSTSLACLIRESTGVPEICFPLLEEVGIFIDFVLVFEEV